MSFQRTSRDVHRQRRVERLRARSGPLRRAMADHRSLLRDCLGMGRPEGTPSDAFFVVFATATDAVGAAVDAQRRLAGHPWPGGVELRVRMGLHTGEPTPTDEGYVGVDLHRAARICSAGHGGQVLLSETTRQLLEGREPAGVALRDMGPHRLKDRPAAAALPASSTAGWRSSRPQDSGEPPDQPPTQPTPLLGRARSWPTWPACSAGPDPLVTLTGPGGTGKTAGPPARPTPRPLPRACSCRPAATTDPAWCAGDAQTLGVRRAPGAPSTRLQDFLGDRRLLLLLDNSSRSSRPLPGRRPARRLRGLRVLAPAASRCAWPGSRSTVPPLPVPPARPERPARPGSRSTRRWRCSSSAPGGQARLPVTNDNAPAVAEIASPRRPPPAIELSAARAKCCPPRPSWPACPAASLLAAVPAWSRPPADPRAAIDWS